MAPPKPLDWVIRLPLCSPGWAKPGCPSTRQGLQARRLFARAHLPPAPLLRACVCVCVCVCVCAACHAPLLCALHGRTIFNGNGKLPWELELAVEQGVLINIDSEFDFENIKAAAKKLNKPAKTLLRINPDVDPQVHAYAVVGRKWGRGWLDCCLAPRHWSAGGQNRRVSTTIACSRRGLLLWHRSCVPAIHIRKRAHTHTHTHTCAFTAHSTRMRTMSCVSSLARAPACRCTPTCPPAWPPPSSASATHTSR